MGISRRKRIFDMKISASLFAIAAAIPAKDPKGGKFVQDPDAPRLVCGGEITDDAIITSPGFDDPGHYPNNIDCTWEINIAGVSGFMIHPEVFEVEDHSTCVYDSLNINWEETTFDTYTVYEEETVSSSKEFNYKFCSHGYDWDNFDSYTTWASSTTQTSTQSTSTSYYDGSSGSSWSTTAYPTSTSTEYEYPSGGDYYDSYGSSFGSSHSSSGRKRRAPVKGTLNSSAGGDGRSTSVYFGDFTAPLEVAGGRATIRFQTDLSVVLRGFKLRIEKGNSIEPEGCDQVQNGSGRIDSPAFPEYHGNNELCKYTLNAEPGKMIKIMFHKFDVESQKYCNYDSLSIMGRKHCGEEESRSRRKPAHTVVVTSDSTELVWETDGSVTQGGFSFTWESIDNPIQLDSAPLESAESFHDHMELFQNRIRYQMKFHRPHMVYALSRFWEKVKITEEYFQTSGSCDWSYSTPTYQTFDFKDFDENVSQCENLANFANNAEQFIESFVCMDEHEVPKRTFRRWMKMASNIRRLADAKSSQNICW